MSYWENRRHLGESPDAVCRLILPRQEKAGAYSQNVQILLSRPGGKDDEEGLELRLSERSDNAGRLLDGLDCPSERDSDVSGHAI